MGVEWCLYKAEPTTLDRCAEAFEPHPFEPEELDLVFSGQIAGPVSDFFGEGVQQPTDGDVFHVVMPPELVGQFAARLRGIDRSSFAPMDLVIRESFHAIEEKDRVAFYDAVTALAEELRQFVYAAERENRAIVLEVC